MKVKFVDIIEEEKMKRAVQLCSKTNQFNLRTIRHTEEEIKKFLEEENNVSFLVSLSDKYGEYGDVGLVITTKISEDHVFLDTFLMSCRVMQRHLESQMLLMCCEELFKKNIKYLSGEYIPTQRNGMTAKFLENHGLEKVGDTENGEEYKGEVAKIIEKSSVYKNIFS